jgi:hypothetical protein
MEYCRLWIESYALKTKDVYFKLLEEEPNPLETGGSPDGRKP